MSITWGAMNGNGGKRPTTVTNSLAPWLPGGVMRRSPLPKVCSGKMLALELYGRKGTMVVTLRTSQPSRSINTDTMQLYGLESLSRSRLNFRSFFKSSSLIPFSSSSKTSRAAAPRPTFLIFPLRFVWRFIVFPLSSGDRHRSKRLRNDYKL
jgi:hypothetical protein